mmetsp:Transcript_35138/g.46269  ORF Transcript_35138/g.46269 Transcript_35138/m.46269 type:complete len:194 (+) Transcript_35138:71-652(+)|eukprot:CAMPEP_0185583430 /NCGR_PEP_ID=MMETSP0434-20130131/21525_1 /TAXON_ID=626734 ORGANISM="Favella taraikaensis, Strain Fe Narragansett Bay" /NCGR_SAMPLE_ID=MMETSP0434 /ASSEMBLY_ACC=CAM_ASM_000379 /LENGTH=193 /DNA_ID=CAMNT_0028202511 /DNA_START=71 /DNA_END=652 /DNA_ORIENTATION=+
MDEPLQSEREIHVSGTDNFRRYAIIGSLIASCASVLLLLLDPRSCDIIKLEYAVYLCSGVHLLTFLLLLSSYLCTKCVNSLGRLMVVFYFMLVGSMVYCQVIFFHGQECNRVAPILYYWIFTNILLFYVVVAYGLSLWGAYICWEVDEEEKLIKEAMATQLVKNFGNKEYMEKLRLAGWANNDANVHARLLAL